MTECVILDSIPIRTKASVVDKFVGVQRLKEEQDLLIREMINFMAYYRDIVLNKLEAQHHEIKEKIGIVFSNFISLLLNLTPCSCCSVLMLLPFLLSFIYTENRMNPDFSCDEERVSK